MAWIGMALDLQFVTKPTNCADVGQDAGVPRQPLALQLPEAAP